MAPASMYFLWEQGSPTARSLTTWKYTFLPSRMDTLLIFQYTHKQKSRLVRANYSRATSLSTVNDSLDIGLDTLDCTVRWDGKRHFGCIGNA